jgi:hypothetical protein
MKSKRRAPYQPGNGSRAGHPQAAYPHRHHPRSCIHSHVICQDCSHEHWETQAPKLPSPVYTLGTLLQLCKRESALQEPARPRRPRIIRKRKRKMQEGKGSRRPAPHLPPPLAVLLPLEPPPADPPLPPLLLQPLKPPPADPPLPPASSWSSSRWVSISSQQPGSTRSRNQSNTCTRSPFDGRSCRAAAASAAA